jgi:hypothetical protein
MGTSRGAHSRGRTIKPQRGELRNAWIDRQERVEVVSLSKLSFLRQWVALVCQSGSKRWTVQREKTPDHFDFSNTHA